MSGDVATTPPGLVEVDPEVEATLAVELEAEFVIERLLGRGGMALVFLAHDRQLNRKVAIKVLPPELAFSPARVERFKREARTAATLDHPHIVPIYRISSTGKLVWFAMKYVAGETLADILLREHTLSGDRTTAIVDQVAEALQFAHQHGVIHRDIKPANVLLDGRGWVTVTDFGIAKANDQQALTGPSAMIGTPSYMSPECAGKGRITGGADQYSLGVMVYQMLSGRLPFVGQSTIDIITQHCVDPPTPLSRIRPGLPLGVSVVVGRALAKQADRRFPSVTEFARALTAAVQGEPAGLRVRAVPRVPRSRARRNGMLATVAALGGLGIGAFILGRNAKLPAEQAPLQVSATEAPRVQSDPLPQRVGMASVRLEPRTRTIHVGERYRLRFIALDSSGNSIDSPHMSWRSTNPAVARVDSTGVVFGIAPGDATVEAAAAASVATAVVLVRSTPAPALPPSSQTAWVEVAVRENHRAFLYINDVQRALITRLDYWPTPAGSIRLSIREAGCTSWDSTVTVAPGDTAVVGYRNPRCP